ncbi:hypothetical protein LLT3_15520 [Lactococcus cremoris subsp. cremoris TIFN3]|uniref:Transposase n=1 Tax=Lactococcus cremoris subsp. cremoris TIFN3 TaxID=1234873 RepID=T0V8A5_LACLC|nr:hypothetical protein LLT3_15520 [Lactococcus cremoris subsp. cremoris TIFN3]
MNRFKGKQFKKDVIIVAVGYYVRYNLSYREVQELLYDRGINVCHTTTPPISAECQHGQQIPLSLRATRDTAINKKSTNRQQISQKMFIRNSCKYINKVI